MKQNSQTWRWPRADVFPHGICRLHVQVRIPRPGTVRQPRVADLSTGENWQESMEGIELTRFTRDIGSFGPNPKSA